MGQRRNQPRYVSSKAEPEQNDGISCGAVPEQREQRKNRGTRTVFRAVFRYAVSASRQFLRKSHTGLPEPKKRRNFTRVGMKSPFIHRKSASGDKNGKRKPPFRRFSWISDLFSAADRRDGRIGPAFSVGFAHFPLLAVSAVCRYGRFHRWFFLRFRVFAFCGTGAFAGSPCVFRTSVRLLRCRIKHFPYRHAVLQIQRRRSADMRSPRNSAPGCRLLTRLLQSSAPAIFSSVSAGGE